MKLRSARLFVAVLAVATACKKSEQQREPPVAPIAPQSDAAVVGVDPWDKPDAKLDPLPRPLFWSIEKDGNTSYAFGTMHMGVDPFTRIPPLVWKKLDAAKTFAMETDLSGAAKLDIFLKGDRTLRDLLGEAHWKKLEDALGKDEAAKYIRFKPMIPATIISMRSLPQTPPMDGVLLGRAINQGKPIVYLEDIVHEAAVLEKWMTVRALKDMLDDLALGEKHGKEMFAAYLAGDDVKLLELSERERSEWKKKGRSDKEYNEQMEDLLYKRNAAWIAAIEKLHAEGGGFIAVGAMHLVGKRSVLDLLQKKGYTITRIAP